LRDSLIKATETALKLGLNPKIEARNSEITAAQAFSIQGNAKVELRSTKVSGKRDLGRNAKLTER
jgi:hypothetical protein